MRKWLLVTGGGLMLAACGGSGGGGSSTVPVMSGVSPPAATPTPAPTASPTPTPAASPTPTPTAGGSYPRFADLAGDRSFQTACASVLLGSVLPTPQPLLPFGEALTFGYAAAAGGWTLTGDTVSAQFAAADAVVAATGQRSYERTVAGSTQRFTVTDPVAGGTALDYVRTAALRTTRASGGALYSCVFGVPAAAADAPTAAVGYGRVTVTGTAYVSDQSGTIQTYALTASTGTLSYDPAAGGVVVRIRLVGNLQTGAGTATSATDLGTFTGGATVDAARSRFAGQLDSADRVSLFSSFGGWFFGGSEAGAAFGVLAADPGTGNRVSAVGTVSAAR